MADGVNRVHKDGRYQLPPAIAEEFTGEYLLAVRTESGVELRPVEDR